MHILRAMLCTTLVCSDLDLVSFRSYVVGLEHILGVRGRKSCDEAMGWAIHLTHLTHSRVLLQYRQTQCHNTVPLQMCDVVHDGPAFDGVSLCVDEMEVDLRKTKK